MTQDLVKRLSYLRECIDLIPSAERSWYVVDSPWLGSDVETFIISGSPDPNAGTMVCDFQDTDMAGVEGRFSDEEWSSRNWTHAKYIEAADPAQVLELLDALEAKDARISELEFELSACAINDPNFCGGLDKIQEGMQLLVQSKSWAAVARARK